MPQEIQGPDGNTYQFPDGTDKSAAVAYFKKKGIGVSAPKNTAQTQPAANPEPTTPKGVTSGYLGDVAAGGWQAAKNIFGAPKAIGQAAARKPVGTAEHVAAIAGGPGGLAAKRLVVDPAIETGKKAVEHFKKGEWSEGAGYLGATLIPMLGPWAAEMGEQIGTGDPHKMVRAGAEMIGTLAGGELAPKLIGKALDPMRLRTGAAKLEARAVDTNPAETAELKPQQKPSWGAQKARVIAASQTRLPELVRAHIETKIKPHIDSLIQDATARGVTHDVGTTLDKGFQDRIDKAGSLQLKNRLVDIRDQFLHPQVQLPTPSGAMKFELDRSRVNNLTSMTPVEGRALMQKLNSFTYEHEVSMNKPLQNALKDVANKVNTKLGDSIPGLLDASRTEAQLIEFEAQAKLQAEKSATLKAGRVVQHIFSATSIGEAAVSIGGFGVLHLMGVPFFIDAGVIGALRAMAKSVPSRTFRAAVRSKLADLIREEAIHGQWPKPGQPLQGQYMPMGGQAGPPGPRLPQQGGGPVPPGAGGGGGLPQGAAGALPPAGQGGAAAAAGAGAPTGANAAAAAAAPGIAALRAQAAGLMKALPAPPPPKFRTGMRVTLEGTQEAARITAVHGDSVTIETPSGYRAMRKADIRPAERAARTPTAATKPQSGSGLGESKSESPSAQQQPMSKLERQRRWREKKAAQRSKGQAEQAAVVSNQARAAGVSAPEGPSEAIAPQATPEQMIQGIETAMQTLEGIGTPNAKLLVGSYRESIYNDPKIPLEEKYQTLMDWIKATAEGGKLTQ